MFHLEDFGSLDKSEIDILLIQDSTAYIIEVKAFTNANDASVKRELVRNYIAISKLKEKGYFEYINDIRTILLYSESFHEIKNPSGRQFNYFNEKFLYTKGKMQTQLMDEWYRGHYKLTNYHVEEISDLNAEVKEINKKLFFLTWDDVFAVLNELNENGFFDNLIKELSIKKDIFSYPDTFLLK